MFAAGKAATRNWPPFSAVRSGMESVGLEKYPDALTQRIRISRLGLLHHASIVPTF
jgi:hypothetical protein